MHCLVTNHASAITLHALAPRPSGYAPGAHRIPGAMLNALIAERVVHPITRAALLDADKARALNLKLDADQGVEVCAPVNTFGA